MNYFYNMKTLTLTQTGTTQEYIEIYNSDFINIDSYLRNKFFEENTTAQNVIGIGNYKEFDWGFNYSIDFSFE